MNESVASPQGFTATFRGRDGVISYAEPPHTLQFDWEMSGSPKYDILVTADFRRWSSPPQVEITQEHQLHILHALRHWLRTQRLRSDIDAPTVTVDDTLPCMWRSCHRKRLAGFVYCAHHFDLSCLRS